VTSLPYRAPGPFEPDTSVLSLFRLRRSERRARRLVRVLLAGGVAWWFGLAFEVASVTPHHDPVGVVRTGSFYSARLMISEPRNCGPPIPDLGPRRTPDPEAQCHPFVYPFVFSAFDQW
jgi:hypothetical protein